MEKLNEEEIEAEGREQFALEQAELVEKWREKGRKKPGKAAMWENFWKGYKMKRNGKYKGGIDNIRYTYEFLEPLFFPYYYCKLTLQIHEPNEFECDINPFLFQ
jgi:hypothetical protein